MDILKSVNELLSHIKEVELDTIKMSQDSMLMLDKFLEDNNIQADDNAITTSSPKYLSTQHISSPS